MNDFTDLGAMQRAAEQRVYEMQCRSDEAVHATRAAEASASACGQAAPPHKSILSAIQEPDRLLRSIPDEYLLLALLVLLIAEKANFRLIVAVVYLMI